MTDQAPQPESGGSRGCLFAALGAGCLLVLLLVFAGAGFLFFARSERVMITPPPRALDMSAGPLPTDMIRDESGVEAAFSLYSEGQDLRADFGAIRLEWPGRGANNPGGSGTNISLSQPPSSGSFSSYTSGSRVKITTSKGVTTGQIYEASFTITQGTLLIDGKSFDAVDGPPTVIVLDKAGKITEVRAYEAPVPVVDAKAEPASPAPPKAPTQPEAPDKKE